MVFYYITQNANAQTYHSTMDTFTLLSAYLIIVLIRNFLIVLYYFKGFAYWVHVFRQNYEKYSESPDNAFGFSRLYADRKVNRITKCNLVAESSSLLANWY